jgi:hypothetical protein
MSRIGINAVPIPLEGDNGAMDTTQMDELLARLEQAGPGDAPDIADEVAATLAATLDGEPAGGSPGAEAMPGPEPGSSS